MIAFIAPAAVAAGLSLAAGVLPAAAQYYYDRPPGFEVPIPPAPVPEAPWARRPWAPPPGAYDDDAMPRRAVEASLSRQGFSLETPLRRRGDVYIAEVMDRRGTILRLTVDAYEGVIISRRVIAEVVPDWGERPRAQARWRDPDWDDDAYDSRGGGDQYAAREPDPLVIPAPPMPKGITPKATLPRTALPKIPVPPARPSDLQSDAEEGDSAKPASPPVAQATPLPAAPAPATKSEPASPETVDIDPPDLPEVGAPSF
ncbi:MULTISPECIES: hypothetical protein [unclassified Chelatococcus]|uniref:hypothetical protein n=1 Tax=unclassified Chelatococcus TaxID=2638111 RepID=UPI001BCE8CE6|nr:MULTISPECIES: hypothetical protein [unclassified Chelatococcus]MBS7696044.1 hypothetical protein [Chelatococcus sp. YT9]MBX3558027.1 hypothetical protein [Chelatococcus sp.]